MCGIKFGGLFSVILLNLLLIVKQMSKIIEFNIVVKRDL